MTAGAVVGTLWAVIILGGAIGYIGYQFGYLSGQRDEARKNR